MNRLAQLKGSAFDNAYVQQMVTSHENGIRNHESAERDVRNADLKEYITSTLPVLRQHLEQARMLARSTPAK